MISENLMTGIPSLFGLKALRTSTHAIADASGNVVEIDVELFLIAQIRDLTKTSSRKNVTLIVIKTREWCRGTLLLSSYSDKTNEFDNAKKFEPYDLAQVQDKLFGALKSVDICYIPVDHHSIEDGPGYSINLVVGTEAEYTDMSVDSMQGDNLSLDNLYYALQGTIAYLANFYQDPDIHKAFF